MMRCLVDALAMSHHLRFLSTPCSNHADLSPRYASVLLGLTNTSGAVPGVVGVIVTGALLDATGSWPLALFVPSIFFFVTGSAVFAVFGSADVQDFSQIQPFWCDSLSFSLIFLF